MKASLSTRSVSQHFIIRAVLRDALAHNELIEFSEARRFDWRSLGFRWTFVFSGSWDEITAMLQLFDVCLAA